MNAFEAGYSAGEDEAANRPERDEARDEWDGAHDRLRGAALAAWEETWNRGYEAGKRGD